jgi:hypothetical protein
MGYGIGNLVHCADNLGGGWHLRNRGNELVRPARSSNLSLSTSGPGWVCLERQHQRLEMPLTSGWRHRRSDGIPSQYVARRNRTIPFPSSPIQLRTPPQRRGGLRRALSLAALMLATAFRWVPRRFLSVIPRVLSGAEPRYKQWCHVTH